MNKKQQKLFDEALVVIKKLFTIKSESNKDDILTIKSSKCTIFLSEDFASKANILIQIEEEHVNSQILVTTKKLKILEQILRESFTNLLKRNA